MLRHAEPPGYRRREPPKRPKLAPFTDIIDLILEEDLTVHRKQRHTSKRIFERLRDEHGFTGKQTIGALDQAAPLAGWELLMTNLKLIVEATLPQRYQFVPKALTTENNNCLVEEKNRQFEFKLDQV